MYGSTHQMRVEERTYSAQDFFSCIILDFEKQPREIIST
jgi:hypothetical protein